MLELRVNKHTVQIAVSVDRGETNCAEVFRLFGEYEMQVTLK